MAEYTEHNNLILPAKTENYNVEVANTNNRIIDEELHKRQLSETGKGLSTNDFTNAYKAKLDGLNNYDDTDINEQIDAVKEDIKGLKNKNIAQDSSIQSIQANIEAIQAENSEQSEEITELKEKIAEQSRVIALHEKNAKKAYVEPSTHITVTDAAEMDAKIGVHGTSTQKVTEQSENLCPNIDDGRWVLSGGAYRENGYIVLPQYDAKAYIDIEWNGQSQSENGAYTVFWGANFVTTDAENAKYLVEAIYLNVNKEVITSNGNGLLIGGTDIWKGYWFSYYSDTTYGQAIRDAKYIRYRITYSSSNTAIYKFKNPLISKTSAMYIEFVPDSPSTAFPSKINRCGDNINMFDETVLGQYADTQTEEEYKFATGALYNKNLLPAGTAFEEKTAYTLQYVAKQTTGNPRFAFRYTDGTVDEKQVSTEYSKIVLVSNPNKTVQTINVDYGSAGQFFLKKGSIQLEKGNRATKGRKYNCGAVHVDTCKTNILNIENIVSGNNLKKFEITDKSIVITPNNTSANVAIDIPVCLKKSEQYSLSQTSTTCQLRNGVQIVHNASNNIFSTFALADNVDNIRFWFGTSKYVNGTLTIKKSDFMLVKGNYTADTMPEYEEYQGETVTFPLAEGQKLNCSKDDKGNVIAIDRPVFKDNKWQLEFNVDEIALNANQGWTQTANTVYTSWFSTNYKIPTTVRCFMMCNYFPCVSYEQKMSKVDALTMHPNGNIEYRLNTSTGYENNSFSTKEEFTTFLAENNIVLLLPRKVARYEDCTEEQSNALNKLQKRTLCKGTNNVFCIDEVPAKLDMHYTVATDMITDKLAADIAEIKSMLTTTAESEAN